MAIITVFISSCKSSDDSSTTTSSGLFIAVGGSGTLLTSSDGTTWTAQTTGTTNALRAVAYDGSSKLVAVGWSGTIITSSDGKTYTFKLRKGVRFHDGKPMTAHDVVFSCNEVLRKHNALARKVFPRTEKIYAPDDTRTYRRPASIPDFPLE